MKDLAIFIHIGNIEKISDFFNKYLDRITINFNLFVNFCTELVSKEDINETKKKILQIYPKTVFFCSENRGCDIGPLFLFLNHLRKKKLKFKWIMHLHTKTDDVWRKGMLNDLIPEYYDFFWKTLSTESIKYVGSYKYSYDYINYFYDIENLEKLCLEINTDWNKYREMYEETKDYGIVQRINHALCEKQERLQYVPHVDKETFSLLFGDGKNILPGNIWNLLSKFRYTEASRLFYVPGNFFMCRQKSLDEIFCSLDFMELYSELEKGKVDDKFKMSRTHSWERIIPIAFQLKFGENCLFCVQKCFSST